MPRATPYRLTWVPERGTYMIRDQHHERTLPIVPGTQEWFAWLASIPSFTFSGQHGQLTVRQEARSQGGAYWYAYRRSGEKMRKRYLGRTTDLTLARLEEIALQLTAPSASPYEQERLIHQPPREMARVMADTSVPLSSADGATSPEEDTPPDPSGSGNSVTFTTKLSVPRPRAKLVRRARLLERLQRGREVRLILLSAPAGFGKTTLLAQWLSENELPVAWVSLDPEDNEPVRFLSALIAALQVLDPHFGASTFALLHTPSPAPPPQLKTVVALLIDDLLQHAHLDVVLVLDDYHVITDEAPHQALASLVEHAPPQLHLIIATRSDPALPIARLRARGQLCEVRAAQLQFMSEETNTFLHTVMGLDLSDQERAALQSRTEGWIAGLQLAALSLQGRADTQQFLSDFTGSHRHIVDYLVEEVLGRQPDAVQSFLLRTSLLDRFSAPLCDAVTGGDAGEKLLAHLDQANLFLVPLDERREWYRYHHLFADMLRARLRRTLGTEELVSLYGRASRWYERNGFPAQAVEAALAAADFQRAADLIDFPLVNSMIIGFQHAVVQRWLEQLPKDLLFSRSLLCVYYAWALFVGSGIATGAYEAPLQVAERLCYVEGNQLGLGQAYLLRSLAATLRGDGRGAITYGREALAVLPEDARLERNLTSSALARGYRLAGEVTAAWQAVTEVHPRNVRNGILSNILDDQVVLGDLLVLKGKLHEAAESYQSVIASAGVWQSFAIQALIGLASLSLQWNELDTALSHLGQANSLAKETHNEDLLAQGTLLLARVRYIRGEMSQAVATFRQARVLAQQSYYLGLETQAQAYQVRYWLAQGQMEEVARWQAVCILNLDDGLPRYEEEVIALTLGRILIAQGETAQAVRLLDGFQLLARAQGRISSELEMLVLSALALQKQGKHGQALPLLEEVLALAEPEGYMRLFVDEGAPMAVLLRQVQARPRGRAWAGYLRRLIACIEDPPFPAGLSAREVEVLRLVAQGLTDAQVAEQLVISPRTVNTHLTSIYNKLGIDTRAAATRFAVEQRLS